MNQGDLLVVRRHVTGLSWLNFASTCRHLRRYIQYNRYFWVDVVKLKRTSYGIGITGLSQYLPTDDIPRTVRFLKTHVFDGGCFRPQSPLLHTLTVSIVTGDVKLVLEPGLRYLTVYCNPMATITGRLPKGLRALHCFFLVNHNNWPGLELPDSLRSVTFQNVSESVLDMLPGSLRSLTVQRILTPSEFGFLASLTHLVKLDVAYSTVDASDLPNSVEVLTVNDLVWDGDLVLPSSLRVLNLGKRFNRMIPSWVLPSRLECLCLGKAFNQEVQSWILPETLRTLDFGNGFNHPIKRLRLPSGLRRLVIGSSFNQEVMGWRLPSGLKELHIGHGFNRRVKGLNLPHGLELLYIGFGFQTRIIGWKLPTSLRRVNIHNRTQKEHIYIKQCCPNLVNYDMEEWRFGANP